jgi:phycobilisome rod-core linker protein
MTLPNLAYAPRSQNQRVTGYEIGGDETAKTYDLQPANRRDYEPIIAAAYRQIFHEQQSITHNRQVALESQLRNGAITVREFVAGLAKSPAFRRYNYETNSNYRFARICVQRLLGREVYNDRESMAWSIQIATQGVDAFIDALVNSDEYNDNFGDYAVPHQRRRILPQRAIGDLPFERMARYDQAHLQNLRSLGYFDHTNYGYWQPPEFAQKVWLTIALLGGVTLTGGLVAVALAAWGYISL